MKLFLCLSASLSLAARALLGEKPRLCARLRAYLAEAEGGDRDEKARVHIRVFVEDLVKMAVS